MEAQKLESLVVRLRAGDPTVREEIIGGHMRLCMSIVSKYSGRYPYIVDDLVGAAMIGLCQAVDWAAERMYDNNITPYIYQTCERFVKDFIERRLVIQIPRKQFKTWQEENDAFLPLVVQIESKIDEDNHTDELDLLTEQEAKCIEDHPMLLNELLQALQLQPSDYAVVDMLLQDYSQREIAKELGVSDMWITKIKQKIRARLAKILGVKNEDCGTECDAAGNDPEPVSTD